MRTFLNDITPDDCREFQQQHPQLKRCELERQHNLYYRAMKHMGLLDELYPSRYRYSRDITLEQCEQFRRDHPDMLRDEVLHHYVHMQHAMQRLGCFDRLFPSQNADFNYQTDEELIQTARQYQSVSDMKQHHKAELTKIYARGLKHEALKHMKPMGDRKKKYIYAFEFPDHSVYVGLTYDLDKRRGDHMKEAKSAVLRHIQQTGLQPTHKRLTDQLTPDEASKMEGHWEEQYRQQGWTILNVAPTGALGGYRYNKQTRRHVADLSRQGHTPRDIAQQTDLPLRSVYAILKQAGLSHRGMSNIPVEVLDEEGHVIQTFPSVTIAADHYGMKPANLRSQMRNGYRVHGHHIRYNPEAYERKYGHPYNIAGPRKHKH